MQHPPNGGQTRRGMRERPYVVGPHQFGRGLYASRSIATEETVLRFRGPLIDFQRSCNPRFEHFCVQVAPNLYTLTRAPERYINHSCEPNTGFEDERTLRALRPIVEGEELTFDYSTSMAENAWTMQCRCQTSSCRLVIGDFIDLPTGLKIRYRAQRIIPGWLNEEFEERQLRERNGGNGSHP